MLEFKSDIEAREAIIDIVGGAVMVIGLVFATIVIFCY